MLCTSCKKFSLNATTKGFLVREDDSVEVIPVYVKVFQNKDREFVTELTTLKRLQPVVAQPIATFEEEGFAVLITRDAGIDLHEVLRTRKTLSLTMKHQLCQKLLNVTRHCHTQRWAHLDLKPRNICISETTEMRFIDLEQAQLQSQPITTSKVDAPLRVATPYWAHPEQWIELGRGGQVELSHWSLQWDLFPLVLLVGEILLADVPRADPDDERPILMQHLRTNDLYDLEMQATESRDFSPLFQLPIPANTSPDIQMCGDVVLSVIQSYCKQVQGGGNVSVESVFDGLAFFKTPKETMRQVLLAHESSVVHQQLAKAASEKQIAACNTLYLNTGSRSFEEFRAQSQSRCLNIMRNFAAQPRPDVGEDVRNELWMRHAMIETEEILSLVMHYKADLRLHVYRRALPQRDFTDMIKQRIKELEAVLDQVSRDLSVSYYCSACAQHCPSGGNQADDCQHCVVHCHDQDAQ